jgi:hypothetical protein
MTLFNWDDIFHDLDWTLPYANDLLRLTARASGCVAHGVAE